MMWISNRRRFKTAGLACALVTAVSLVALSVTSPVRASNAAQPDERPSIVEIAVDNGSFKTLVAAVQAAGLVETLQGDGPFTVFAPTDEAFAKIPAATLRSLLEPGNRDTLTRILTYHVVPGRNLAVDALRAGPVATVQGDRVELRLEGGQLKVNEANVLINDIRASNGVIHVIDTVLMPPVEAPKRPSTPTDVLTQAIERGAPLFNDGNPEACTATYETAIESVCALAENLSDAQRGRLEAALDEARAMHDVREQAWVLRRAMDTALQQFADSSTDSRSPNAEVEDAMGFRTVFDFESDSEPSWFSLNDDVMGGVSTSAAVKTDDGTLIFRGALSLENNGGFATIRSRATNLDLGDYNGLVLRVRGDGRVYGVSGLPSDRRGEFNSYRADFETRAGEWIEVKVPFEEMKRSVMGRRFPNSTAPADDLRSLSVSISDKNETPYELEVEWIRAYRAGDAVTSTGDTF